MRLFIALELSPALRDAIVQQTATLRLALGPGLLRCVRAENLHLTLKFLGEVTPKQADSVLQLLREAAEHCPPFEVTAEGLGCFPNNRQPRVVWIGLQVPEDLINLWEDIEVGTTRLGFPPEERAFSPHLTIARVQPRASQADLRSVGAAVQQRSLGRFGSCRIESVRLLRSDLQPGGPIYTAMGSAGLTGAAALQRGAF